MSHTMDKTLFRGLVRRLCRISFIILLLAPSINAADWPQFQKDKAHSGLSTDSVPLMPVVKWSTDVDKISVTPIISSGLVYVLTGNGTLSAFDKRTGERRWQSGLAGWELQTSTPACSGEEIFAATDSGILAGFDESSGQELWNHSLSNKRFEGPLTYSEGRIYLGEGSGYGSTFKRYFCFTEDGIEVWNMTRNTTGYQWCGACIQGNYLIFGANDGSILSLDRRNGTVADELILEDKSRICFAQADSGRIRASVSCRGNFIYTTSESSTDTGYVWKIGFDMNTGRFLNRGWSTPIGFSTSTPAVLKDRVYLGAGEHGYPGEVLCLDDTSGEVIWSYPLDAGVKSSPALSFNQDRIRICFTTARMNGSMYCLEDKGDEAQLIWEFNPPDDGYILGGAVISDGLVYFGTDAGRLYCLGEK